jgi:FkbM family methyltransferase
LFGTPKVETNMSQFASTTGARETQAAHALYTRVQKALAAFPGRASTSPRWEGRKTVVYGAGSFGRDLARALLKRNVAVLGFLDRRGSGQLILDDLQAHAPGSAAAKRWLAEKPVALIGTHSPPISDREIAQVLAASGFAEVVTPMESYLDLSDELGSRYWLATAKDYSGAASSIDQARALWADAESERLFLETLLFRLEFDLEAVTNIGGVSVQYTDPSLPRWKEPLRMVDGGAFTGDTLRSFLQRGYRFEAVHAFEPDLANFSQLRETVSSVLPDTEVSLWPCGIWSATTRLKFAGGTGGSSRLSADGTEQVPVVALDEVLHGQRVDLIKLDVEAAEPEALQGARHLIEKNRPGLAVCLYHCPHHLWSIPLWVAELNLGYRLYFRVHEQSTFETVLYAIPA